MRSSSAATSSALSVRGSRCGQLRRGQQVGRVGSRSRRARRSDCGRRLRAASLRAIVRGAGAASGRAARRSGAAPGSRPASGSSPLAVAQARARPRRCRRRGACARRRRGAAGRGRTCAARRATAQRGAASLGVRGPFFIDTDHGSDRHPAPARRGRLIAAPTSRRRALAPDPGHARRDHAVVRGDAQAGRGTCSSAPCAFATPTTMPPCCSRGGRRSRSRRSPATPSLGSKLPGLAPRRCRPARRPAPAS